MTPAKFVLAFCVLSLSLPLGFLRAADDLLINGSFNAGTQPWTLDHIDGAKGTFTVEAVEDGRKAAHVEVSEAAAVPYHIQLFQGKLGIKAGESYHFSFRAKADSNVNISVNLMIAEAPWTSLWKKDLNLTPEWQDFSFDVTPDQTTENARVTFSRLASKPAEYWFTDVSLTH